MGAAHGACTQGGGSAPIACQDAVLRGDGPALRGMLLAPEGFEAQSSCVVLYLGGCGAPAAASAAPLAISYLIHGAAICVIDYRGFGLSDGTPDAAGLCSDAERMLQYLMGTLHVPSAHIVLHGYARGASVAAELAAHRSERQQTPLGGLVLDRPMASALSPEPSDQSTGLGWLSGLLEGEDTEGAAQAHIAQQLRRIQPTPFTVLVTGAEDALGVSGEHLLATLLAQGFEVEWAHLERDPERGGYDVADSCKGCVQHLCEHVMTARP